MEGLASLRKLQDVTNGSTPGCKWVTGWRPAVLKRGGRGHTEERPSASCGRLGLFRGKSSFPQNRVPRSFRKYFPSPPPEICALCMYVFVLSRLGKTELNQIRNCHKTVKLQREIIIRRFPNVFDFGVVYFLKCCLIYFYSF